MSLSGGSSDGPIQGAEELRDAGLEEEGLLAQSASSIAFKQRDPLVVGIGGKPSLHSGLELKPTAVLKRIIQMSSLSVCSLVINWDHGGHHIHGYGILE